jgi:formate/nitrite transporter
MMLPTPDSNSAALDALLPDAMAQKAEAVGVKKAVMPADRLFVLAVLAGAFIAFGAVFATTVSADVHPLIGWGPTRLLAGVVFSLGLVLVIVGGAELFTGNNLIVMAWASGKVSSAQLLRNWAIVFAGNLVGSLGTAAMVFLSEQYTFGSGAVGRTAIAIAEHKLGLGVVSAFFLGVLCNVLVCLAVWLAFSARTTTDRVLAIVPPIAAFVAAGFEHSVANMYFVPVGILIAGTGDFASDALSWGAFVWRNLIPVTLGNIVGGAGLVGAAYWFVYLRQRPDAG